MPGGSGTGRSRKILSLSMTYREGNSIKNSDSTSNEKSAKKT